MLALLAGTMFACPKPAPAQQVVYPDGSVNGPLLLTATTELSVPVVGTATQGGAITEAAAGFGIVKTGVGTLILGSGANSYTGATTINQGALSVGSDAVLGNTGVGGLVFDGGTLITTGSFTTNRAVTLNAGGGTFSVPAATTLTLSGLIAGVGGLTKTGAGELVIDSANALHDGLVTIAQGSLGANDQFGALSPTARYAVEAGATLRIGGQVFSARVGALSGAGRLEIGGAALLTTGLLAGAATFSGVISGSGSLRLEGWGTQILAGAGSALGGQLCNCGPGTFVVRGGDLTVGENIEVQAGALVVDQGGRLANASPFGLALGAGTIRVDGVGSSLSTGPILISAFDTDSSITVSGGARLTSDGAGVNAVSFTGPASARILITGAGSLWTSGGGGPALGAVSSAPVSLTLADGGRLVAPNLQIEARGTLNLGAGAGAGVLDAPTIENRGAIIADFTDSMTLAAAISDIGTLTKRGAGTLILTGASTYTGTTFLDGGAISVAADANLGGAASTLALNGGVLRVTGAAFAQTARPITFGPSGGGFDIVEAGNTFTVTQDFSGAGGLSKAGAGALVLKGAHTYSGATTVTGGTLRAGAAGAFSPNSAYTVGSGATLALNGFSQTIGSLAGAGAVTLGAATLTTGGDNGSTTFSGAISGAGGLVKAGAGALALTGTSTYTGPTSLNGGSLIVNGAIAGSVVTIVAGTLGGTGTVGGLNAAGGVVAPGNSIGTLNVAGDVAFRPGSTYRVEVNAAGQSDRIAATGSALITGGAVEVLAEQGDYGLSTRFTILTAQGGVNGAFSSLSTNLAFLTPTLSYGANDVVLTLARNDVAFAPPAPGAVAAAGGGSPTRFVAVTRNQIGVGRAAEALGAGNRVFDALIGGTEAQARAGFDLLSGEAHAQAVTVAIETGHLVRESLLARLRGPLTQGFGAASVDGAFAADLPGRKGVAAMPAPVAVGPRLTLWGEAIGAQGRGDSDGSAASLDRRGGGMLLGAEWDSGLAVTPWRAGVAAGFTRTRIDLDARRSSGEQDAVHAALYGGASFGPWSLRGGAAFAWNETDLTRVVAIRGFSDVLRHDGRGASAQAFAEIGHALALGPVALEPFAQIAGIAIHSDSATERGGPAALALFSRDQRLGFTTLGLRAEMQVGMTPLVARGLLGWRHAFGDATPRAELAFASGGQRYRVYAAQVARDALVAEAGLAWRVSRAASLGVTYSAALGAEARDHALKGRIDIGF